MQRPPHLAGTRLPARQEAPGACRWTGKPTCHYRTAPHQLQRRPLPVGV